MTCPKCNKTMLECQKDNGDKYNACYHVCLNCGHKPDPLDELRRAMGMEGEYESE